MYDNAEYLNVSYPPNMTPEEQLEFVTETAKVLMQFSNIHSIYAIFKLASPHLQLHSVWPERCNFKKGYDSQFLSSLL